MRSTVSRYAAVAARFVTLIERGTLRAGDRLPSLRRTSGHEGVSLTTTLQAYALLESRGYIEARPQSGYYVRPHAARRVAEPVATPPRRSPARVDVGQLAARLLAAAQDPGLVPLGAACPSPDLLPSRKLARLASAVSRRSAAAVNTYSFPPGRVELRREIARRSIDWGGALAADEILVTSGATEALALALRAVTRPGDLVAVESPAYFGTLLLLETLELRAVEVLTDTREGLRPDALAGILHRHEIAAVVASPACHNPLGATMPRSARQDLVALLAREGVPLIEDDVYGDAHYDAERPAPAKAWDRGGGVLLCGSFSKLLAPGYRVGWLAAGKYQARVAQLQLATSMASPTLPQLAVAAFIRSGAYDQFLKRIRRLYQDQVARGRDAIARFFPAGTRVTQPQGGFVVWLELPEEIDALPLAESALAAGISVSPGHLFSAHGRYRHCLRLNCGHPWTKRFDAAVEALGALARASQRV